MGSLDSVELQQILRDTRTVAVVGVSDNPVRPSNEVYRYLARYSHYELYPINPNISELDGKRVYPSLADLPVVPDMVDVFRRYDDLPAVLADTLALDPLPKYLWLQQGLWHDEVGAQAQAAGLRVVMDRCLKVDYAQLIGR
ncbi:CoA-binding protein [Mycolicibacterium sphagni]|uniref:CoA-binding protein n=1 Tax=Mycolicibacterium sphagni TaxID=1786 RepID=A0A255DP13_9MYCO|nr:CoA-binding protein [Mycolicibacterium sphagni]MCV7177703.1 CoA-binding protein [Mycolicibacterium sphagni]OYN81096.1 CoA-binding protein [Mycolicibacterium sphagni]